MLARVFISPMAYLDAFRSAEQRQRQTPQQVLDVGRTVTVCLRPLFETYPETEVV
jgi:hypothetical protein